MVYEFIHILHVCIHFFFCYKKRLSNEFQNQAKLLHNMEEQICNYEIANKKEVANRLKDQLSLLKVSF